MDKDLFLKILRNNTGRNNMMRRGRAGICIRYRNVVFYIYRNSAFHYLQVKP